MKPLLSPSSCRTIATSLLISFSVDHHFDRIVRLAEVKHRREYPLSVGVRNVDFLTELDPSEHSSARALGRDGYLV